MKSNKIILIVLILNMVALIFTGCGGNPVVPPGDEPTIEEEYNTTTEIGNQASQEYLNLEDTYGKEQALQMTVDYLEQQTGIEAAFLDEESGTISFEFSNGMLGAIITHDTTQEKSIVEDKVKSSSPIGKINFLLKGTPTEKKAILLCSDLTPPFGGSSQHIREKLESIGYWCRYEEEENVTVELMKTLSEYGVVYIDSHGGIYKTKYENLVFIITGQKVTTELFNKYYYDLKSYQTLIRTWPVYDPFYWSTPTFAILPAFITKYTASYPDSLIYIDACDSYKNPTMAQAFIDAGAYAYCGYSTKIMAWNYSEQTVFNYMVDEGWTLEDGVMMAGANNLHYYPQEGGDLRLVEGYENHAPVISSLSANPSSINIDQTTTITCTATDEDFGDSFFFEYTWSNNGGSFEGDISGSSVTWRAPSTPGNYTVSCEVSDGEASVSEQVIISVGDVNHAPVITSAPVTSATKNQPYSYDVNATDPDVGDTLTYSLTTKPTGMNINTSIGVITWTPSFTGDYDVIVKVSDSGSPVLSDTQSFTITVEENGTYTITASAGSHGSISPSGSISINQGSDKSFTITPDTGYQIDDVLVDGSSKGAVSSYTFTNVTQDHTIYATFIIEEDDTYDLRDIGPAGGYIFYDKGSYSNGWRYLEAAPVSTEWNEKQWGSYGTLIGGTGTGIGTGENNTSIIVSWLNSHGETDRAAQLCDALVYGGYSDWFLPSRHELNLMYENLKVYGVGGFTLCYWSSSESLAYSALFQCFLHGYAYYYCKDFSVQVRAVRAF